MKYLGVDWGAKHVGLATSEGSLATPLGSFTMSNYEQGINNLESVINNEGINIVVIGKPEGEMGEMVDRTIARLKQKGFVVFAADETLSSKEALSVMIKMGKRRSARADDHATAAALILQRYLDEAS